MRRVLPPDEFAPLAEALPARPPARPAGATGCEPGVVTDPSDPKLAHLDGLNLSRAWMLEGIASGLAGNDRRRASLLAAAARHREAGLAAVTGEHYEGGHWLGTLRRLPGDRPGPATHALSLGLRLVHSPGLGQERQRHLFLRFLVPALVLPRRGRQPVDPSQEEARRLRLSGSAGRPPSRRSGWWWRTGNRSRTGDTAAWTRPGACTSRSARRCSRTTAVAWLPSPTSGRLATTRPLATISRWSTGTMEFIATRASRRWRPVGSSISSPAPSQRG